MKPLPAPNPKPVEVLAYIPLLKKENPNKTGWIVGWLNNDFFCTPGFGYSLDYVEDWQYLPEAPQ